MDAVVPQYWREGVTGSELTSMKVGGVCDYYAKVHTVAELRESLAYCVQHDLLYKVVGGGSNLIFPDSGVRGVIIRPAFSGVRLLEESELSEWFVDGIPAEPVVVEGRYTPEMREGFLQLSEEGEERQGKYRYVALGAGVPWGQAVTSTLRLNLSGLHWFARIPCQVGGAVYNNIHGAGHLLSEVVVAIKAYHQKQDTEVYIYPEQADFGYDSSIFHTNGLVITEVLVRLLEVSTEVARKDLQLYQDWTKEKATIQPSGANCGSVFKNLSPAELPEGISMQSAGWYVDQCGWKGKQYADVQVYPGHANFIVNLKEGTQADFISLVTDIRTSVYTQYGVELTPEAECINEQAQSYVWPKLSDRNS